MRIQIQKWGNSLALRIPRVYAQEAKIHKGSAVDIALKEGKFVLTPLAVPIYTLKKLLADINKKNTHQEQGFGRPQGVEIW